MDTTDRTDQNARLLAGTQHGVIANRQLRALGHSERAIRHLRGSLRWEPLSDEVVRLVGSTATESQRHMAAVLDSGPSAVLSHFSGARCWGLTGCPRDPVHTTRLGSSQRGSSLARIHQVRSLPAAWTTRLDAIPIVRPELLAMQLFATCSYERAERLVERMWSDRLLSGGSISRFLSHLGARGRNGIAGLREYAEVRGPGYTPAASGVEARAMQIFRDNGFEFRRQVDVGDTSWTGRVDFLHAQLPVVVEVQSERHHTALTDVEADRRRREALELAGFIVVELTDVVVWTRPDLVSELAWEGIRLARLGGPARSVTQNRRSCVGSA